MTSGPRAVTVGNFDGVHLGHQELLRLCLDEARHEGWVPAILTFDPHPASVVSAKGAPPRIQTRASMERQLREHGVQEIATLRFDEAIARLSPAEFVDRVLVAALKVEAVIVGDDFRFGAHRSGDAGLLRELGRGRFRVIEAPPVIVGAERVSSSRVRAALAAGDLEAAASLLGRRYEVESVVVHGDHRGRELGYPTANLALDGISALPSGIYAADAFIGGEGPARRAAVSFGVRPTFDGQDFRLEAYIIDFDGDLYGRVLRLVFLARLRDEERFPSVEALREQIGRDVAAARDLASPP